MAEVPVLQQMYARTSQAIVERQPEKLPTKLSKPSFMDFFLPMLVGILFSGIPLAIVLTLYLGNPCKWSMQADDTMSSVLLLRLHKPANNEYFHNHTNNDDDSNNNYDNIDNYYKE